MFNNKILLNNSEQNNDVNNRLLIEKGEINSKTSSKKMSLDLEKIKNFSN